MKRVVGNGPMGEVVITGAVRTAIGTSGGALAACVGGQGIARAVERLH